MEALDLLKPGERVDDLQWKGLRVLQNPNLFRFGTDSVLLAHFAKVATNASVLELGTGSGVVLLLLSGRVEGPLTGVEIQPDVADMAARSVQLNGLEERMRVLCADMHDAPEIFGRAGFDNVVCNPPYGRAGATSPSEEETVRIARHEVACTLASCVRVAAQMVKNGGRVSFVHQAARAFELAVLMQRHFVPPKRARLIHPSPGKAPNLVLLEGIKLGRDGVCWLPPLTVHDENGRYTEEMLEIYHKKELEAPLSR